MDGWMHGQVDRKPDSQTYVCVYIDMLGCITFPPASQHTHTHTHTPRSSFGSLSTKRARLGVKTTAKRPHFQTKRPRHDSQLACSDTIPVFKVARACKSRKEINIYEKSYY